MSYSAALRCIDSISDDLCKSPKVRETVNAALPTAVGGVTSILSVNPAVGTAAGVATHVAVKNFPDAAAKVGTSLAVGVALDLATPIFMVCAAVCGIGWLGCKAIEKIDEALSN